MTNSSLRSTLVLLSVFCSTIAPVHTHAAPIASTLQRPSLMLRDMRHVVLLSVASAGTRLVTVGERGVIGVSDDNGKSWRQVQAPVSVTLTAVRFVGDRLGWATGHRGVILHSADGGDTWTRQLDGNMIATQMAQLAGQIETQAGDPDAGRARRAAAARQIATDGADKPLFDLYFRDERTGFAVGAYGLALTTTDGGRSWRPIVDLLDNPKGLHLYAIEGTGNALYIAGEQGMLLRSRTQGQSFERLKSPYRGSFFTLHATGSGALTAAGLNGNTYNSADAGSAWQKVQLPSDASLTAMVELRDGTVLLGDQAGRLFASGDGGRSFSALGKRAPFPLSGLTQARDGSLTGVGLMGAIPIHLTVLAEKK